VFFTRTLANIKMTRYLHILTITIFIFGCGQLSMKTPKNAMEQFEKFKSKVKFEEDASLFYPGIGDPAMRLILTEKINATADDFSKIAAGDNPTDKKYQDKIRIGLTRFATIYIDLDTEDRERVCSYFEELMYIVELENSDGQLNKFMYGFDSTN
jgi:Domain of unknown function (DUF4844)